MSSNRGRGSNRSANRGKNRNDHSMESPVDEFSPMDVSDSTSINQQSNRRPRNQTKNIDEYRRIMDIVKSRISVIIDSLEGDDNDASIKRNVATAVKHLKQIDSLLDIQ